MAKEKLLVVTERFYPEEFLINDLVLEFNKIYDVEVLTQIPSYPFDKIYPNYNNKLFSTDEYHGIPVHRVYTKLGYRKNVFNKILGYIIFAMLTWLKAFSFSKKADKVFFYHTGPATMAHSVHIFKKLYKFNCYIWTQDIWPDAVFASGIRETRARRQVLEIYLKRLYSNFNSVLISCKGFAPIINHYYKENVVHIPQWSSNKNEGIGPNIIGETLQFTFLGNLGSVQNLDNVCYGFLKAVEAGLKAKLNIVGDGVLFDKLKRIVEEVKTNDILLWGRRPSTEMSAFINNANIMVISLKEDPLFSLYVPAKFQGYTAGGRPILGILKGEVADIIEKNDLGYTADPSNIDSIASGFMWFGKNEEKIKDMCQRSHAYYEDNYDREKCINRILNEINS